MVDLRSIVTTVILLVIVAGLFSWSYSEYVAAGQINFTTALAAAGGVALLLSVLKVWNPNIISRATGSSIDAPLSVDVKKFHHADDSTSSQRKRWWRE